MFCEKCGYEITQGMRFCERCGNPVTGGAVNSQNQNAMGGAYYGNQPNYNMANGNVNPINTNPSPSYGAMDLRKELIGSNCAYYTEKFNSMDHNQTSISWNWCAFLFSGYWFIYRKMYKIGFAILGAHFILYQILSGYAYYEANWSFYLFGMEILPVVLLGVYGNSIYLKHINEKAYKISTLPEPMKSQMLRSDRGTDVATAVVILISFLVFAFLIAKSLMEILN